MPKRKTVAKPQETRAASPVSPGFVAFLDRHSRTLLLAFILLATIRIVSTYTVFNHTYDEPAHIACGMEWLDKGTYYLEPQHPPLSRVAAALGPYLMGIRMPPPSKARSAIFVEGQQILDAGHNYDLTLALARLGVLPFFWIACAVVYWWGLRFFSPTIGLLSAAMFSFLPPVLAHAGLATTDMALTAFLGASFLCGMIWLQEPTTKHALWFGAATGLVMISKFSCLVFLPASVALALIWYYVDERPAAGDLLRALRARLPGFGLAVVTACFIVWAGYRFSLHPQMWAGIKQVMAHNAEGHTGYLLGERRTTGFWYFYEVALAVKTPLGFLALMGVGIALACRKQIRFPRLYVPFAFSAAILVVGVFSRINIGIRHVLPIYMGFSLLAGAAAVSLLETGDKRRWVHGLLAVLVVWFAGSSLLSHPDYIPYFNELAGSQPEKILVDSDLDWGQDLKRLGARLREVNAPDVAFVTAIVADLQGEFGFPPVKGFRPAVPVPGWNAVSVSMWKEDRFGLENSYLDAPLWPDRLMQLKGAPNVPQPERVGKSILLWYFPPK